MVPKRFRVLFLLVALASVPASAAVRVTAEGAAPFVLLETAREGSTAWYDAEEWLSRFPGAVASWDPDRGRLTYHRGPRTSILDAGKDQADLYRARVVDGRPLVSEAFLLERSSDFLGLKVAVEPLHGTGALRVVLDPGHGGADIGSRAAAAPPEKEVVLRLAQDVAAKLRRRGFEVHLTREDDRALSATERAAAANRWEADLFLSLHASGEARPLARGFEVFVSPPEPPGTDPRLWASAQVGREADSRRWAEGVRAAVGQAVPSFDRGVRHVPTPLLEAVAAPACLLEAGNLSSPEDAEALLKPKGRAALAEALADAAETFFRESAHTP
ncbi:MAG: N-acetylmuramoyl-L-alanine amidase [Deltaproteobacteria bacterium]|nr:N-acetylmuramoyl-L-alanine amidase [Deltaproteobacteria bacterium]